MRIPVCLTVAMAVVLFAGFVHAAGIGDPVQTVRAQYGTKIFIDDTYYVFGTPPRVARIDIDTRSFFGTSISRSVLAKELRPLMPTDTKPINAYTKQHPNKDIYTFKSMSLAKVPGVKDGALGSPLGTFTVYVTYGDKRILNCNITMGLPNSIDLGTSKKIANPFKSIK